jgi:hypothetical protein
VCGVRSARWLLVARVALLSLGAAPAYAQQKKAQQKEEAWDADQPQEEQSSEDSQDAQEPEEAEQAPAEAEPAPEPASTSKFHIAEEHRTEAATYRLPEDQIWSAPEWDGGRLHGQIELDTGYAQYRYPEQRDRPKETLHDMRGRFVLGPTFRHDFPKSEYFLKVTGQFVAWVREQADDYQINVDDVYVQFGSGKNWDLQVGRFMTWRVYHKGLGFDLYTLEDNGASEAYPISNEVFAVHTYEVDYIYLRNSPYVGEIAGRAAFHYYPLDNLGFELATAYGLADNRGTDTIGGRLAMDLRLPYAQFSAAGEYRSQFQTAPPHAIQDAGMPTERDVECAECGATKNYGFGGGLSLFFSPVSVGGNFAIGWDKKKLGTGDANGKPADDPAGSDRRMSFGGYFELDIGSLLLDRALILGVGANRTELVLDSFDKKFHVQSAAYLAYPLGLNNAMLKLVVSQAQADLYDSIDTEGSEYIDIHPESTAVRLRFSSDF